MITKFYDNDSDCENTSIEFKPTERGITITCESNMDNLSEDNELIVLDLSKSDLFDLIGQLLRIQSQLKTK